MVKLAPKSWAVVLGGAVALALVAQVTGNVVVTAVLVAVALAAVFADRDRSAARVTENEGKADVLVAERNALGDITTAIAHHQPPDKTLKLIADYAGKLIGGGGAARIEALDGADNKSGPGRVRAIIMAGGQKWGTVIVEGVTTSDMPAGRLQLLQNFADLAGLAIATARTRQQLLTESSTDSLTGLANQRAFHRELAEEMSRARRHRRPLAVILLDLDRFKTLNDREGQAAGDQALAEVATRIRGALRLEAFVARLGGDEMAVVLPECDAQGGYVTAERVRAAIGGTETRAGQRLTASAGVAALEFSEPAPLALTGTPDDPASPALALNGTADDLLRAADAALSAAKRIGGDTAVKFTPQLGPSRAINPESLRAPRADVAQSA